MAEPPEPSSTPLESSLAAHRAATEAARVSPELPVVKQPALAEPVRQRAPLLGLWTLVVRLLILSCGMSLGWVLGVLVAQVFPARNPNPPWLEVGMRQASQTWRQVRQLPQGWQGSRPYDADLDLAVPTTGGGPAAESVPRLTLAPDKQQQVEESLARLQADFTALENRLTELETSLGQTESVGGIETRLQQLELLINPPQAVPPPADPPSGSAVPLEAESDPLPSTSAKAYVEPPFSLATDTVVLPSTLLFGPEGSLLTETGKQLLNTILPDLLRYPEATLLVGSHTASDNDDQADRQLTFQQALTVQRYLAQQLGDTSVRLVAIGYGQSRPRVVGSGPEFQTRNRRVELGIVPQY